MWFNQNNYSFWFLIWPIQRRWHYENFDIDRTVYLLYMINEIFWIRSWFSEILCCEHYVPADSHKMDFPINVNFSRSTSWGLMKKSWWYMCCSHIWTFPNFWKKNHSLDLRFIWLWMKFPAFVDFTTENSTWLWWPTKSLILVIEQRFLAHHIILSLKIPYPTNIISQDTRNARTVDFKKNLCGIFLLL